jgi:lipopolysaccharide export system protein LptA
LQLSNNVSLKSEEVHCSAERALWEKEKQLIKLMGGVSYCFRDVIIKADYVELHGELNNLEKVLGIGNVEIESIADDLKIRGEKLEYFIEKGKSVIKGNVQISKEDVVAKCREALFFEKDRKLVLLGAPQLTQGENRLSGDKIIFYGEKIEAIGSVRAVFFPKEEEEDVLSKSGRFD